MSSKLLDTNFQTLEVVATYMAELLPKGCNTVLEPTPGSGMLVRVVSKIAGARVIVPAKKDFWKMKHAGNQYDAIIW